MFLPKFLIADNSEYLENTYVVYIEKPRFAYDVDSQEVKWLGPEPEADDIVDDLISQAAAFYESELDTYEEEFENEE